MKKIELLLKKLYKLYLKKMENKNLLQIILLIILKIGYKNCRGLIQLM